VTLFRRLIVAVRTNALPAAIGFRLRQLAYANSHRGDHYLKLSHRVLRRMAEQPMTFSIDVVSDCNLECPTCPVASWPKQSWTGVKGIMEPALLHQLIGKAIRECLVGDVNLYAYTEPLLHPRLPELIEVVKSYGLTCTISTNLNVMRDADALLAARPDQIRISVSGFDQHNYGVSHAGGRIDVVKTHMRTLADARKRLASNTVVTVLFHKYRTNLDDLPLMKDFAMSLGLGFDECWATFFPLEKVLTYAKPELALAEITDADRSIIERLAVPLDDVVELASRTPVDACSLQDSAVVLDVKGSVYLCCYAAMDATRNKIASYLDTPLDLVQARKKKHNLCTTCMAGGLAPTGVDEDHDFGREIGGTTPLTR
jgi:pyruvate-formate lyase-activating enzyme